MIEARVGGGNDGEHGGSTDECGGGDGSDGSNGSGWSPSSIILEQSLKWESTPSFLK